VPGFADAPFTLAVNLSAKQFAQPDLVSQVTAALRAAGVDAKYLTLEVTESVFLERHDAAATMISNLKRAGVSVRLDDFGTGYSSLGHLHRLPFEGLKIDRAFVSAMDTDENQRHLVRTILTLGRELGLHVTAEGVTSADQLEWLRDMGCPDAQGYFFSAPLTADELARMTADGARW
jgi:EAL domain-containing protein (putative c-di-GMP-specific phosphodiesterase class I)